MKLLFTDLDETLLNTDKSISKQNLEAIDRMTSEGHRFIINTGRATASALKIARKYNLCKKGYYISAYNGGQIIEADTLKSVYSVGISEDIARLIFKEATKFGVHVQTYSDELVISEHENAMLIQYCKDVDLEYKIVDDAVGYVKGTIPKVICADLDNHKLLEDFKAYMAPKVDGVLYHLFSNPRLLEFGNLNSSKGEAIEILAGILGVDIRDTIGVGDEENDIDMIKHAGIGVAMINGKDTVKAVADVITENDNNHGAIAEVIEKYILN